MYPYITIFQSFGLIPFFIDFQTTDCINTCIYTQKTHRKLMFLISPKHIIKNKTSSSINISTITFLTSLFDMLCG